MKRIILAVVFMLAVVLPGAAQEIGKYYPIYFTAGIPVSGPIDKGTAGLKFQFGTSIPLWKDIGQKEGLDLDFVYNQVSVWDFFDVSSPFRDHTFMPGVFLNVPLSKDELLVGIEHRSNGRPLRWARTDIYSRSITYAFAQYGKELGNGFILKGNVRAGFGWYDDELTLDLFHRFLGYADLIAGYRNRKLEVSIMLTPVFEPFHLDVLAEVSYRIGACSLFAQFSDGHRDALCDWMRGTKPTPYLRFGVLFGSIL